MIAIKKTTKGLKISKGLIAAALILIPTTNATADDSVMFGGDARTRIRTFRNRLNSSPDIDVIDARIRGTVDYAPSDCISLHVRGSAEAAGIPNPDSRLQDGKTLGYEISVDRAFITLKPKPDLFMDLGEQTNQFSTTIPHTDKDMPILGATITAALTDGIKLQCVYDAGRLMTQDTSSSTVGAQLLGEKKLESITLTGNMGYQHSLTFDERYRLSNSTNATFDIISAGGTATFSNAPIAPTKFFIEYTLNPSMPEENQAMMGGIKIGEAKEPGTFSVTAQYKRIEKDSLLAATTVRDSPRTNITDYSVRVDCKVTDTMTIYLLNTNPKHIIPSSSKDHGRQHVLEAGIEIKF